MSTMSSPMRALVTGASGFVGRHLIRHLEEAGDDVIGVDRETGGIDITDANAVTSLLERTRPTVVYHLAGWADVGGSWQHPVEAFRANAEGTLNVLSAATAAGVERVLAVSSADVYGIVTPDELPLTEDSPLRPASPYAASKVAADYLGLQAWLGRQLPVLRVRAFNHLGPGQTDKFVAPALASRIARAERDGSMASASATGEWLAAITVRPSRRSAFHSAVSVCTSSALDRSSTTVTADRGANARAAASRWL